MVDLLYLVSSTPGVDLITRLRLDAQLYDPAPERKAGRTGRLRVKGARRASPDEADEDRDRSLVRRSKAGSRSLRRDRRLVLPPEYAGPDPLETEKNRGR
jgi:hypothetical protein